MFKYKPIRTVFLIIIHFWGEKNKKRTVDSKRMKTTNAKADASVPGAGNEPITGWTELITFGF